MAALMGGGGAGAGGPAPPEAPGGEGPPPGDFLAGLQQQAGGEGGEQPAPEGQEQAPPGGGGDFLASILGDKGEGEEDQKAAPFARITKAVQYLRSRGRDDLAESMLKAYARRKEGVNP